MNKYQQKLEESGYEVIITEEEIKVTNKNYRSQYITFDRKTEIYDAHEVGSEITFATSPIFNDWRNLILTIHYKEETKEE
ncbi:MAG: hypothetical protein NC182_01745 [Prevotella sp.]|nr:hypothetical protein [Staphylococcus sp.]MCM1349906.1 hypothetical protein [Prevotella sp.]